MASQPIRRCSRLLDIFDYRTSISRCRALPKFTIRTYSQRQTSDVAVGEQVTAAQLDDLLANPTWSVESLLPPKEQASDAPKISSVKLHHLLRLSALPLPETEEEEHKMLKTLSGQLHFVGEIQQVDTSGIEPLRALRDETAAAEQEQTITLDILREALARENVVGIHYKRIQRDTTPIDAGDVENWDALGSAERKMGKFLIVESQRPQE